MSIGTMGAPGVASTKPQHHAQTFVCPTDDNTSVTIGCGKEFEATPERDGTVECLHCGMWFDYRDQPVAASA